MYAVVEIAGLQYKVEQDQQIYVNRLKGAEGDKVSFDRVMLTDNNGSIVVGAPVIEGVAVNATILKHVKADKVLIFKKKRRKGYQKLNGFRASLTQISIDGIGAGTATKKAVKAATPAKAAVAVEADDLRKVEGIGPKIAEIFNAAGINTFAELAATSVDKLKSILEEAGPRYASKVPDSWPKQAKMAADGKWDELKEWQDNTKGGIE
jgi:large subunit ribosomal protein L21